MDPLSVAASIIGILAAATKVVELLTPVISSLTESTKSAAILCTRVEHSRNVLSALQKLLNNLNAAPRKRKELIPIDHLIASLTNGVLLFSELEALVLQLGTSTEKLLTRIQWARKDKTLTVMISRLQGFEISISAMLNILQCESDLEAVVSQKELYESNLEISRRLAHLENSLKSKDSIGNHIKQPTNRRSSVTSEVLITQFEFEGDLVSSRPYRKAQRPSADFSFRSSVVPSHAWSALSDVSLSDISVIAVIALPISPGDITNGHHYEVQEPQLETVGKEQVKTQTRSEALSKSTISPILRAAYAALIPPPIAVMTEKSTDGVPTPRQYSPSRFLREYKLVVLGYGGIGKSALTLNFVQGYFPDEYDPTIEDTYRIKEEIDDEDALLNILDTGGQEEFSALREQYIRTRVGFVLVYSVTSRASFEELIILQQTILRVKDKSYFPMVLVGNKCDLESDRQVSTSEGQILACQFGCPFLEVSAKERMDVKKVFHSLVREIKRYEAEMKAPKIRGPKIIPVQLPVQTAKSRNRWLMKKTSVDAQLEVVDEDG